MGLLDSLGGIVGGIGGFLAGGPSGAVAGYQLGSSLLSDGGDSGGGGLLSTITGALDGNSSDIFSSIAGTVSDITSSIHDVVSDLRSTLEPIVGDISSVVHDISGAIRDINDNLIQPIVGPIKATIDSTNALVAALQRDLAGGIKGILEIPGDIARAFDGVDVALQRSFAQLGLNTEATFKNVLIPALLGKKGGTLGDVADGMHEWFASTTGKATPTDRFSLSDQINVHHYFEAALEWQNGLYESKNFAAQIFRVIFEGVAFLHSAVIKWEPYIELAREQQAKAAGIKKLGSGDTITLLSRDELTEENALEELRVQGYSDIRARALLSLARTLLNVGQITSLYQRRHLEHADALTLLKEQGYDEPDSQLVLNLAVQWLDVGTSQELYRRGLIGVDELQLNAQRNGMQPSDSKLVSQLAWRLLGLTDVIQLYDRAGIEGGALGFSSLQEAPPQGFNDYASKLGVGESEAQVLWQNHYRLLDPGLGVSGFFRGLFTRTQLTSILKSFSIPEELHDAYIELQRPLIPYRSIPSLVTKGILTEVEAALALEKRGFDAFTVNAILRLSEHAAKPSPAAAAEHLHGLTQGTVLSLYDAHAITREHATELLLELHYTSEGAEGLLELHDVHAALAERAAAVDLTIAQTKAGLLDFSGAAAELQKLGMSGPELSKALARLTTAVSQHTKMPGESKILSMWKHGILDEASTLDALGLLGYSEGWAMLLIKLEGASGSRSQGQSGDSPQPE